MVLICNNNILTIEQFHKNRCIEKNDMLNILYDIKYNKDKFKETPYEAKEQNGIYVNQSNNHKTPYIKPIHSKYDKK